MDEQEYESRYIAEFCEKHKDAEEWLFSKDKKPLCAIYITPWGRNQEEFKNLMKMVQGRMIYECDLDDGMHTKKQ